ncbi:MAG TPA: choice-of-anchor B family protein [Bacteriovoracaceae bacterium]|nr:choice-of-anchor B family protein [Bacteriovoracaceae bacterium]
MSNIAEGRLGTISIYDNTNPANMALLKRFAIPNAGFVHNVWPSEDEQLLISTEETSGKTVKIWDISDLNNINLLGEYLGPNGMAHNAFILNNKAYLSHYRSGLRILNLGDPTHPTEIASLQKNVSSSGAWGVYPFFLSGKVIISDIEEGLFVGLPD